MIAIVFDIAAQDRRGGKSHKGYLSVSKSVTQCLPCSDHLQIPRIVVGNSHGREVDMYYIDFGPFKANRHPLMGRSLSTHAISELSGRNAHRHSLARLTLVQERVHTDTLHIRI